MPSPAGCAGEQLLELPRGAGSGAALPLVKEAGDGSRVVLCSRKAADAWNQVQDIWTAGLEEPF